jgi:uncharacterized membrane protein
LILLNCDARMTTDNRSKSKKDVTEGTAIGLAIGVGLGVLFGTMMDNLALGIALGAAFGLIFGFAIPSTRKSKSTSP